MLIQRKKEGGGNQPEKARKLPVAKFLNPNNKSILSNPSQGNKHFVHGSLCLATDEIFRDHNVVCIKESPKVGQKSHCAS